MEHGLKMTMMPCVKWSSMNNAKSLKPKMRFAKIAKIAKMAIVKIVKIAVEKEAFK